MKAQDLKVSVRDVRGNGPCRVLRRDGFIPAVLYGPGAEPVALTVSHRELSDIVTEAGAKQVMLNLQIEDQSRTAMIKELQSHPVTQRFLHADFYEVAMDRKISVMVPVEITGKCVGVEMGGLLQVIRRELEIICLPMDIPDSIVIDVTDLDVGNSVHLSEIAVPDAVEFPDSADFTVVTVVAPVTVEEEVPEGEEGEEEAEGEEGAEEAPAESEE